MTISDKFETSPMLRGLRYNGYRYNGGANGGETSRVVLLGMFVAIFAFIVIYYCW
jgi:hypothetical protein